MLTLNGNGYYLYEVSHDEWIFDIKNGGIMSGTFKDVVKFMAKKAGFDTKDIQEAIEDMLENDNNAAHFGMHKRFIYSFNKEGLNKNVKAS